MTEPYYEDEFVRLFLGDCRDAMADLPEHSVDAVVCDPPYDLTAGKRGSTGAASLNVNSPAGRSRISTGGGFMGKSWDATGVAFDPDTWRAAMRVLKPGGYGIFFGGTRTFHRLACALEDAGFEIRDSLAWLHGQGFPKNRNVTADLRALPACACDIASQVGSVSSVLPASTIRAGAGTEPGAVGAATSSAELAQGIGPKVVASRSANDRASDMNTFDIDGRGQRLPVVLGASPVTAATEGEQIAGVVSGIQRHPEPLGNQMVGEQAIGGAAVGTGPVSTDDRAGDVSPASSLVLPLSAAPGGVSRPVEAGSIVDDHAVPGTVDARIRPTEELVAADGARVDSVAGSLHAHNSTAERLSRCEVCGGVRGIIPEGLGTALKPAFEPIVVARKPLAGTVAANVLQHGTGALNIDGCRIGDDTSRGDRYGGNAPSRTTGIAHVGINDEPWSVKAGRWPANVVLDDDQAAALDRQSGTSQSRVGKPREAAESGDGWGMTATGAEYDDVGGASRFFYTAKADSSERPTHNGVAHPTVKPLDLMRWLVRLVTPPGGTVLEPFAGSGTTVEACLLEGFRCIAIEREADYLPLILQRIHRRRDPVAYLANKGEDLGLFEEPA